MQSTPLLDQRINKYRTIKHLNSLALTKNDGDDNINMKSNIFWPLNNRHIMGQYQAWHEIPRYNIYTSKSDNEILPSLVQSIISLQISSINVPKST